MAPPSPAPCPTVSIVMTLLRHRGHWSEAIESWLRQSYPADRLELLLVGNRQEPQVESKIADRLAKSGPIQARLLHLASANEMELYDFAARHATGDWLLFTEPHCVAQPDCVAQLIGTLEAQSLAGGCVRTLPDGNDHWAARIESRLYQEDAATWTRNDDWRKFTKRGFALRTAAYRSVGGLEYSCGWFAETAIAARLHARGYRLGFVPSAAVKHYNSTAIGELLEYVWHYQRQMCAYTGQCEESLRSYFPAISGSQRAPANVVRSTLRAVSASLIHGLCRCHTRHGRSVAAAMLAEAARWRIGRGAAYALRYWPARLWLAWPWQSQDRRYQTFRDLWHLLAEWATADHDPSRSLDCESQPLDQDGRLDLSPAKLDRGLFGFHAREEYRGRAFRWTGPASSVLLRLPPRDYELRLDMGGLRAASPASPVHAYFNGRRAATVRGGSEAVFRIPRRLFVADSLQVLTLTCPPLPTSGSTERRALGLPLFGLHFRSNGAEISSASATLSRAA